MTAFMINNIFLFVCLFVCLFVVIKLRRRRRTQIFNTAKTKAHRWTGSIYCPSCLPSGCFSRGFPTKILHDFLVIPSQLHAQPTTVS
jgi:hypothetical protein